MKKNRALIIGAGSAIAGAILDELLADHLYDHIICVSRSPESKLTQLHGDRLQWLKSDYTETSIERITSRLQEHRGSFSRVIICNGVLHNDDCKPEKRFEDLNTDAMHHQFQANAVVPILWLKNLCPVLGGEREAKVAVFSARVGSIEHNRLGGWYSYRASKAALNMLVKSAAIEYRRRAPNVQFMVFHPGTTDTTLSKPFQQNIPAGKLFQPGFVAGRLLELMARDVLYEDVLFVDWAGETVAW